MATLAQALYTRSQTQAGLTSIIGTRFWDGKAGKPVTVPYCVRTVVSEQRPMGQQVDALTRVQVACYAKDLSAARALAGAVLSAFLGYIDAAAAVPIISIDFGGRAEFFDEQAQLWNCPVDLIVAWTGSGT
jgi:hypothetical protein